MKLKIMFTGAVTCCLLSATAVQAGKWPEPPAQDKGLPYTRTSQTEAMKTLKDCIGVFVGGRHGWVYGKKKLA